MYFDLHLVKLEYSRQILKNTQTSNFMKIRPVSGELFYADEWTDWQTDMMKVIVFLESLRTRLKTEAQYAELHICL